MTISQKNIKLLWSGAAGRCSFPECDTKLYAIEAEKFSAHTIGEMAHIKGERTGSNRYDENQSDSERNSYSNLILPCPTHHTIVDKKENESRYTVDMLLKMKKVHENVIDACLEAAELKNLYEVAAAIGILLAENHAVWNKYGPLSDIARKNPQSDEVYGLWRSERLSTIAPNNRKIAKILEFHKNKFLHKDQLVIAAFLLHAKSYQKWVNHDMSYQAVVRFPTDFFDLIERYADARA